MIDWSKEIAVKNYCGYCTGSPASSSCNGECLKKEENRVDHVLEMLKIIPQQIEALKAKEKAYKSCLRCE